MTTAMLHLPIVSLKGDGDGDGLFPDHVEYQLKQVTGDVSKRRLPS